MINLLIPENKELETEAVTSFHWHIDDWKNLETKCHSPPFELQGYEWYVYHSKRNLFLIFSLIRRVLLFPRGNNQKTSFSAYLEVSNPEKQSSGWHICGQFALAISNPEDPTIYYSNSKNFFFPLLSKSHANILY